MRQALLEAESYFNISMHHWCPFIHFYQEFRDKTEHAQMHSCPPFWPFKRVHDFQLSLSKIPTVNYNLKLSMLRNVHTLKVLYKWVCITFWNKVSMTASFVGGGCWLGNNSSSCPYPIGNQSFPPLLYLGCVYFGFVFTGMWIHCVWLLNQVSVVPWFLDSLKKLETMDAQIPHIKWHMISISLTHMPWCILNKI